MFETHQQVLSSSLRTAVNAPVTESSIFKANYKDNNRLRGVTRSHSHDPPLACDVNPLNCVPCFPIFDDPLPLVGDSGPL